MKNRGYIALIAAFFAGLLGLWWAEYAHVPDRTAARLAEPRVLPGLWDARPDDVRRVEIEGGPARLAFERREGDRWQMVEPADVAADPSLVENLAFNLKMLERVRDAGTIADDPSKYGLAPPARTVKLFGPSTGSGPLATLEVGGLATNKDRRYVRDPGSGGIEVVESARLAAVELAADRWRDRMLIRMPTNDVRSLLARRDDAKDLRVERGRDLWALAEPFRAVADDGRVEAILAAASSLRVPDGGFVADGARDADFGLDKPAVTITLTPRGDHPFPQTVLIGKPVPPAADAARDKAPAVRHYARRADQDDVVAVDVGPLGDLGLHPTDLHAKKLADVTAGRIDLVRLTSGGEAVAVARRPKGWDRISPLRDRGDAAAVAELIRKVAEAEASQLFEPDTAPDPRVDRPWAVIELWQDSGPRPGEGPDSVPGAPPRLKLKLGRRDAAARTVYAQVEGDPVVFALPIAFVEGLTTGSLAFRDRQVAAASPTRIERIAIAQGPRRVVVKAPPDGNPARWRLEEPTDAPADPETVGRALNQLAGLRAEALVTDRPESDAKYGLDRPALTVTWKLRDELLPPPRATIEGEETTLTIGAEVPNQKDRPRYARASSGPIVFTIPSTTVALFEAEWRDRVVFSSNPKSADRLTLRWPTLTLNARPVAGAKDGDPDWALVDPPARLKFDRSQLKPLAQSLARLSTFKYAQHAGPIPAEAGLFPPRLEVEVQPSGSVPPRRLRIGRQTPDGYLYATTEAGPSGAVFLLPLATWNAWIRPPAIEPEPAEGAKPK